MSKDKTYYVNKKELLESYRSWYEIIEKSDNPDDVEIPPFIVDSFIKISTHLSYSPKFINYSFRNDMISDALYDCVRFARKFNPKKQLRYISITDSINTPKRGIIVTGLTSGVTAKVKTIQPKTGILSLEMSPNDDFIIGENISSSTDFSGIVSNFIKTTPDNPFNYITTIAFSAFLRRIDTEKKQSYVKSYILSNTPIHEFFSQLEGDDVEMQQNFIEFIQENSNNMLNNEPMALKKKRLKNESKKNKKMSLDVEDFIIDVDIEFAENSLEQFLDE